MNEIPASATIIERRPLAADTIMLRVRLPSDDEGSPFSFTPGQFIQLSVPGRGEFPVSLAGGPGIKGELELCVRRVGHVTEKLHQAGEGTMLGIRGPFGRGYPVAEMAGKDILLIAGGLGIVPVRSLLLHLLPEPHRYGAITLMYGAREPSAMLFREELVALAQNHELRLFLTVDFVREEPPTALVCNVGLLPALLQGVRFDGTTTAVALCGPPALYRCTIDALIAAGCREEQIFLSLERRMKCGQGFCSHCAVGELLCCTDGPVFRYQKIKNIPEAI